MNGVPKCLRPKTWRESGRPQHGVDRTKVISEKDFCELFLVLNGTNDMEDAVVNAGLPKVVSATIALGFRLAVLLEELTASIRVNFFDCNPQSLHVRKILTQGRSGLALRAQEIHEGQL